MDEAFDDEIEIIRDDDGMAVIGSDAAVQSFLESEGLVSKDLGLDRLKPVLRGAAAAAQTGSQIAGSSGRWVKLTKESAQAMNRFPLMKGSQAGLSRGVLTDNGKITGLVQFAAGKGTLVANPAILAGVGGIMAQAAMQQAMDEITDYLAVIDAKVDDILRAQKDAVLADMIGVDLVIAEAMTVRGSVGRVSEITWSKVQATSITVARTQAYALRQLDAIAEKLEGTTKIGDLADLSKKAETQVHDWLAVLARCFQLQDALCVLELDRVLDASPDELDQHRLGLKNARQNRLAVISKSTKRLISRMDAAAGIAGAKVLLHPMAAGAVVLSSNQVAAGVGQFHQGLGIEGSRESLEAKRWLSAVAEVRDKAVETGTTGVDATKRLGSEGRDRARSMTGKLAGGIADRTRRRQSVEKDPESNDAG